MPDFLEEGTSAHEASKTLAKTVPDDFQPSNQANFAHYPHNQAEYYHLQKACLRP